MEFVTGSLFLNLFLVLQVARFDDFYAAFALISLTRFML